MQVIYYGAPGTGKSHKIDTEKVKDVMTDYVFRVTIYPDFTYSDFVGQLLPVVKTKNGSEKEITYEFVKGVFTKALEKAYEDTSKDVYLIIEEMSRGDCAAIFGDIFQLLDREKEGVNKGYSRYFINNEMISKDIHALEGNRVKLPPKFHILGTVNTSDQNVFVMDTAFKRRFEWEYVSADPVKNGEGEYINNPMISYFKGKEQKQTEWKDFYQKLNQFIVDNKYLGLGEDKQIGPFFIEFESIDDTEEVKKKIKNKLLQYLWEDIQKTAYKSDVRLFDESIGTFSDLYSKFENNQIFSNEFIKLLTI